MKLWNDERIESELRALTDSLGSFPTVSEARQLGRNDLCCAVGKAGGFIAWAARLGLERKDSDSDFGWAGEDAVCRLFTVEGLASVRTTGVKSPFDILVEGILRVDVKTANYAEYGVCRGWFYRIGKQPQADLIILYQMDTGVFYAVPWWLCPTSNITISRDGGKYAILRNDWGLIRRMLGMRLAERAATSTTPVLSVG